MRFIKRVSGEEKRMNEAMNSAIAIALAQQREEIAKSIEAEYCQKDEPDKCFGVNREHCMNMKEAASIARGMK